RYPAYSECVYPLCWCVLTTAGLTRAQDDPCPNSTYISNLSRLKSYVYCSYDRWIRPVRQNNEAVPVKLWFALKRIDFVVVITEYVQNVHRLLEYRPHIDVSLTCEHDPKLQEYCVPETNKPMILNGPTSGNREGSDQIYLGQYNMNREWHLVSMRAYKEVETYGSNNTYPSVTYEFVLQRHSGSYAAIAVMPAVVLMLLTLLTYWMKADHADRLIISLLSLFSHFVFLQFLGNMLPSNGDQVPLLMTFYRDSMLLATTALMATLVMRGLGRNSLAAPVWVSDLSSRVLQNRFGQVLVFHSLDPKAAAAVSEASGGEGAGLVEGAAATSGWNTFTTLLNLLLFILTLLTYFILLVGFIP
ncbi:hypothetical protein ANN_18114, partial [Periplaneta americana]